MRLGVFATCVVDALAPAAGEATLRVLRRLGHDAFLVRDATCCGQPAWNAGEVAAAAAVARTTLRALDAARCDAIVVPAGSCATLLRHAWPELFARADDAACAERARALAPQVRELSELLADAPLAARRGAAAEGLAVHHSCHMLRELDLGATPLRVLERIGVPVLDREREPRCCGFGGLFSVKLPEVSAAMADEVIDAIRATGAREVVGCDASCLLQLDGRARRRGCRLRFRHLAEVVDEATA